MTRWQRFLHLWLDWHFTIEPSSGTFDGLSFGGRCVVCRQHCLMDSLGNWFASQQEKH